MRACMSVRLAVCAPLPTPSPAASSPFRCRQLGDLEVALGDAVLLAAEDDDEAAPLALVQAMWQTADGEGAGQGRAGAWRAWLDGIAALQTRAQGVNRRRSRRVCSPTPPCCPSPHLSSPPGGKEVQVRLLARGEETVLGDAASDSEVFLTTQLETR